VVVVTGWFGQFVWRQAVRFCCVGCPVARPWCFTCGRPIILLLNDNCHLSSTLFWQYMCVAARMWRPNTVSTGCKSVTRLVRVGGHPQWAKTAIRPSWFTMRFLLSFSGPSGVYCTEIACVAECVQKHSFRSNWIPVDLILLSSLVFFSKI